MGPSGQCCAGAGRLAVPPQGTPQPPLTRIDQRRSRGDSVPRTAPVRCDLALRPTDQKRRMRPLRMRGHEFCAYSPVCTHHAHPDMGNVFTVEASQ